MSNYKTVIFQADPTYPSSTATTSSTSSYTQSNSSGSGRSYISATASSSSPPRTSRSTYSTTKPAQVVGECQYGLKDFVHNSRSQGGNPSGGPQQHPEGYMRISKGNITVHNTGGQLKGSVPVYLAPEYANGPDHCQQCRDLSRWSDNQGLCFC